MPDKIVNILIVDDDVNIRKTFSRILKLKGFNIEEASSSVEAISLVKSRFFNMLKAAYNRVNAGISFRGFLL